MCKVIYYKDIAILTHPFQLLRILNYKLMTDYQRLGWVSTRCNPTTVVFLTSGVGKHLVDKLVVELNSIKL